EQLIRSAFQCAQVVGGDLLGSAGPRCLRRVLTAAAAFAHQTKELNISLTAVGLMVLTLSGVSRVFHSRFQLLMTVGDFNRSWTALLDYITDFALRRSH
ncbi:Protein MON2-like protein, partial [Operophtera brumata]